MKRSFCKILLLITTTLLFAAARPSLDGRAVVADNGEMPAGLFAKTVGYLPGDSVSVTNPTNGITIEVLVLGAIDPSEGIAILLSPEAATRLGIQKNSNIQVKITKRTGQLDEAFTGKAVLAHNDGTIDEIPQEKESEKSAVATDVPVNDTEKEEVTDTGADFDSDKQAVTQASPIETVETSQEPVVQEPVKPEESDFGELSYIVEDEGDKLAKADTTTAAPIEEASKPAEEPVASEKIDAEELPQEAAPEPEATTTPVEQAAEETPAPEATTVPQEQVAQEQVAQEQVAPEQVAPEQTPSEKIEDEGVPEDTPVETPVEPAPPAAETVAAEPVEAPVEETPLEKIDNEIPAETEQAEPVDTQAEVPAAVEEQTPVEPTAEPAVTAEPVDEGEKVEMDELPAEEEKPAEDLSKDGINPDEPEADLTIPPAQETPSKEESVPPAEPVASEEIVPEPIEDEAPVETPAQTTVETPAETPAETPEISTEPEVTSTPEQNAYNPIVLVPTESVAPETPQAVETPEKTVTQPTVIPNATASSSELIKKHAVSSANELVRAKYYVQIASLSNEENITNLLNAYGKYPIVLVPRVNAAGYQVLVGPLTVDEYGMILEKFKAFGFKDAFVKKVK